MSDMLKINPNWKYNLNIPSQAFPLKTNAELVKILKTYNGSNDIETAPLGARFLTGSFSLKVLLTANISINICLTSVTRANCGIRSTLCWKIPNISGSIELFAL